MSPRTERSKRRVASTGGARQGKANRKSTPPPQPELPHEVLCQIQQHVGLQRLLSSCSLVCKAWKRAADAVTTTLDFAVSKCNRHSLVSLLSTHGSRLHALSLSTLNKMYYQHEHLVLNLSSLSQLKSLSISSLQLHPPPPEDDRQAATAAAPNTARTRAGRLSTRASAAATKPGLAGNSLGHLAALTRLQVSSSIMDFRQLCKCTALRHLQLESSSQQRGRGRGEPEDVFVDAMAAALRELTQLTHLALRVNKLKPLEGILQGFSNLQQLQHLALHGRGGDLAVDIADLAHTNLSGLTRLELVHVCLANGDTAPSWGGVSRYVEQTRLLPAALNNLRQLRHLDLTHSIEGELDNEAEYSSLTIATQLMYIGLKECVFSEDAWEHVFLAGRHLPQLQHIVVPAKVLSQRGSFQGLVSCCPNLKQLQITGQCLDFGEDEDGFVYFGGAAGDPKGIAELANLQHLTKLELRGLELRDGKMSELADLVQLKYLSIKYACDLSRHGLRGLTRLTNLRYLRVLTANFDGSSEDSDMGDNEDVPGLSDGSDDLSHNVTLYNQVAPGGIPNVSQQLNTFCENGEVTDGDSSCDDGSFNSESEYGSDSD